MLATVSRVPVTSTMVMVVPERAGGEEGEGGTWQFVVPQATGWEWGGLSGGEALPPEGWRREEGGRLSVSPVGTSASEHVNLPHDDLPVKAMQPSLR